MSASAYSSADFEGLPENPAAALLPFPYPVGHRDELHQFKRDFIAVLRRIFSALRGGVAGGLCCLWCQLIPSLFTLPANPMPVNARRFIRKMRGGAQAHLLEADDGDYYGRQVPE